MAISPTSFSRRVISLYDVHNPTVLPAASSSLAAFGLPAFPRSQICWLSRLASYFQTRQHRGVAALLLLNTTSKAWMPPFLPTQRCAAEGASFKLVGHDLRHLPRQVSIAGSFLLAAADTLEEAQSLVPAFDGLHLIYGIHQRPAVQCCFLKIQGHVHHGPAESLFYDDWQDYLDQHAGQLILA